jgi:hypothetical protein
MDNLIRYKWKNRHKNVYWVAATEFGKSGVAHCHIIFNFFPSKTKEKVIPDISNFEEIARESLDYVCDLCGCPKESVDLSWQTKFDDIGLVSYFAKKETGREGYKHFVYSKQQKGFIESLINSENIQDDTINNKEIERRADNMTLDEILALLDEDDSEDLLADLEEGGLQ